MHRSMRSGISISQARSRVGVGSGCCGPGEGDGGRGDGGRVEGYVGRGVGDGGRTEGEDGRAEVGAGRGDGGRAEVGAGRGRGAGRLVTVTSRGGPGGAVSATRRRGGPPVTGARGGAGAAPGVVEVGGAAGSGYVADGAPGRIGAASCSGRLVPFERRVSTPAMATVVSAAVHAAATRGCRRTIPYAPGPSLLIRCLEPSRRCAGPAAGGTALWPSPSPPSRVPVSRSTSRRSCAICVRISAICRCTSSSSPTRDHSPHRTVRSRATSGRHCATGEGGMSISSPFPDYDVRGRPRCCSRSSAMNSSHRSGPPRSSSSARTAGSRVAGRCRRPQAPRWAMTGTSWMAGSVRL
jgi:hypothetical protein